MLWSGKSTTTEILTRYKLSRLNKQLPVIGLLSYRNCATSVYYNTYTYYIPSNWEVVVLNNLTTRITVYYIYSVTFYLQLIAPITNQIAVTFDPCSSVFNFQNGTTSNWFSLYNNLIKRILISFNLVFFKKIVFKGKGYRVYINNRKTLALQFGHSHRVYLYSSLNVLLLNKYALIIYGLSQFCVNSVANNFKYWRPINIFTSRGIRFTRDVIYKKSGKESSFR